MRAVADRGAEVVDQVADVGRADVGVLQARELPEELSLEPGEPVVEIVGVAAGPLVAVVGLHVAQVRGGVTAPGGDVAAVREVVATSGGVVPALGRCTVVNHAPAPRADPVRRGSLHDGSAERVSVPTFRHGSTVAALLRVSDPRHTLSKERSTSA
jgi:hypothetical protein